MRLFISYAHVDKTIVQDWIVSKLVAGGHDVWFDTRLVAGQEWKQQLSDEIKRSDALVYCVTPESIASEWCQWELAKAIEFGKPVVPVLMQGRTKISRSLSQLQYVDFSDGPTGDAVARLMEGLQQLSPAQIPPAPTNPQGTPPQAIEPENPSSKNTMMKLLSHPATQAIIGIIGVLIAVVALLVSGSGGSNPEPTRAAELPTPMTPVVVAMRDLDIRSGPDADFPRLNILPVDGALDILGISEDRLWYQVLLANGRRGWVLAASTGVRLEGDRGVVSVIIPTATPSFTPTEMDTPTSTATATATLTIAPTATPTLTSTAPHTYTPTATDTQSNSPTATNTPVFTNTPSQTYPCDGQIPGVSGLLNQVRIQPSNTSPLRPPVERGSSVRILRSASDFGSVWYEIEYNNGVNKGWITEDFVETSTNCPRN